ncbi:MAG TPA: hypothetical protein VLZ50_01610 [Terracidiphilus sp.]|nr:hypothetical protein [Terracidiphilus sp.]
MDSYTQGKERQLLAALRFLWNATRGHRFAPWRSEYLRWRIETYSGKKAETLTTRDVFAFVWSSRWDLLNFLGWVERLNRDVHVTVRQK